jgi:hypothetical protein
MSRLLALLVALAALAVPSAAFADMPSQAATDTPGPGNPGATWSDIPDGTAQRPFIESITVVNGAQSQKVFDAATQAASAVQVGDVSAVISPLNLCRRGQAPAPGQCYATPNRVSVTLGYFTESGLGTDFANPTVPLRQTVTPDTVFDVVVGLNTIGESLRWSYAMGDLLDWKADSLGTPAGQIHIRLKPALSPQIDWSTVGPNGCTATPINNCEIPRATSETLGASLLLSIDQSLDPALTGAVFATQGAVAGYLVPGGSADAPTLDLEVASAHLGPDGTPQRGVLQAFLPAQALASLYGLLPADAASLFTATRTGDAGSQDAPVFQVRTASETSSDGLFVTIGNISFSAPTYRMARRSKPARMHVAKRGSKATVTIPAIAACRHAACAVTVYQTLPPSAALATRMATGRTTISGAVQMLVSRLKAARGSRYLITIRRNGKLVTTASASAD